MLPEENGPETKKVTAAPQMNEREYAQWKYDEALRTMIATPTLDNILAFERANKYLFEIEDLYRLAAKLLFQAMILSKVKGDPYGRTAKPNNGLH